MSSKAYWRRSALIIAVVMLVTHFASKWVLSPVDDGNLKAYKMLVEATTTRDYQIINKGAEFALQYVTDPDLRKLAEAARCNSSRAIRQGIKTIDEDNSLSGVVKGFISGASDPSVGLDSLSSFVDLASNADLYSKVESKYNEICRQERYVGQVSIWIPSLVSVVIVIVAYLKRPQAESCSRAGQQSV